MAIIVDAEGSVGTFMPTTLSALAAAEAGFEGPIIDIEGKIVGAAAASASIEIQPPSLDLVAAIEGAAQLPGVSVSIETMLLLGGELEGDLGALQAALALVLAVKGGLGARVRFVATQGPVAEMRSDINNALATDDGGDGVAVVLVAEESGSVAALRALFGLG